MIKIKIFILCFWLLSCTVIMAQKRKTAIFGEPTTNEYSLTRYDKAPEAASVVLFEKGYYYTEVIKNSLRIVKDIHVKIKVFDAQRFTEGEVLIPYYHDQDSSEKITQLKAITHNGLLKTYVNTSDIFENDESVNWKTKRFAFPDIRDGSILEYTYRIESPYFFNLGGWDFQGKQPKLYSEFETSIPYNFRYSKILIGLEKLDIQENKIKKNCIYVEALKDDASCEQAIYAMYDIPVFQEEKYMLSKKNYSSRIKYEMTESISFYGGRRKFTKSWDDVDNEFKHDKDMGRQLKKNNFFKGMLPEALFSIQDPLEKAKKTYYFIQDHYTWNGKYRIFNGVRVKDAFKIKTGNNTEINLSLINALQTLGLDAIPMLVSTRDNGIPTDVYPVMTEFNYVIALLTLKGTTYLLDATRKETPFGILPFELLNVKGRAMDFDKKSYWASIIPHDKNIHYANTQIDANEDGTFRGTVQEVSTGYVAIENRRIYSRKNNEEALKIKEKATNTEEISKFSIENEFLVEEPLQINYNVIVDTETVGNRTFLAPFFFDTYFKENPFTLNKRNYPIDLGFPITNTYLVSIDLSDIYKVVTLPENKQFNLLNNAMICSVLYSEKDGVINIRYSLNIKEYQIGALDYDNLKAFFGNAIKLQTQEPIVLEKN